MQSLSLIDLIHSSQNGSNYALELVSLKKSLDIIICLWVFDYVIHFKNLDYFLIKMAKMKINIWCQTVELSLLPQFSKSFTNYI